MTPSHTRNETDAANGFDVELESDGEEEGEGSSAHRSSRAPDVERDKCAQLIASGDMDGLFVLAYKSQLLALAESFARQGFLLDQAFAKKHEYLLSKELRKKYVGKVGELFDRYLARWKNQKPSGAHNIPRRGNMRDAQNVTQRYSNLRRRTHQEAFRAEDPEEEEKFEITSQNLADHASICSSMEQSGNLAGIRRNDASQIGDDFEGIVVTKPKEQAKEEAEQELVKAEEQSRLEQLQKSKLVYDKYMKSKRE